MTALPLDDSASGIPSPLASDESLLAQYVAGDGASFVLLIERYQRELFHFLVRFLGNRQTAEDVFQEAFLQVHTSAKSFDTTRRFKPWLFTIAANKARDVMRSRGRRPAMSLQEGPVGSDSPLAYVDLVQSLAQAPTEALDSAEQAEQVRRTIDQMPPNLREILLLGYFNEFSYKQISDMLQIPIGTVKSRLHAAVSQFAKRWTRQAQRN